MHFHSGTAEMIINMINIYLFMKNIWNFFLFPIMDFEKHITPLPLKVIKKKPFQQLDVKLLNLDYGCQHMYMNMHLKLVEKVI